jgi:hypothetical protein
MPAQTVLVVGATGRTGRRLVTHLLRRGVGVRAIVRSARTLPPGLAGDARLTVVRADLLSMGETDLLSVIDGCDAVISCLGHTLSLEGAFGPPRDLVTRATARLCRAIEALKPATPVKYVLMSSVSVHHPGGLDTRRGSFERAFVWALRGVLPPARDNQEAANFLDGSIGTDNPFIRWTVVRPDSLLEGDVSAYTVHERLVSSLFAPGSTNMDNVADFMCELVTNPRVWEAWQGKLPVVVNTAPPTR